MGCLRNIAICLALLVAPAVANAAVQPYTNAIVFDNALSAVALNASAGLRTITKSLAAGQDQAPGYSKARLFIDFTWAAAATVTVVFSCSADGTHYHQLGGRSVSGATASVSGITDSYDTSAHQSVQIPMLEYDLRGCKSGQWVLSGASAGSSDLVTVDLVLVTGI
jgi:hypothetical protein